MIPFGFKEDKAWFIMMLTRRLAERGQGDDLVFMYDGTDIVFQLPPSELVRRYLQLKAKFLVSAEASCWPVRSSRWIDGWEWKCAFVYLHLHSCRRCPNVYTRDM